MQITLKPDRHVPIVAGHPWVFSEAIAKSDPAEAGEIVTVLASDGRALGLGTFNPLTSIRVRMLTANPEEKIDADYFARRLKSLDEWKRSRLPAHTDGYRVVHAEADGIPGLILDRYANTFVFQLHTAGMERLRAPILEAIEQTFAPKNVVERSDVEVRKQEGLKDKPVAVHKGQIEELVVFEEAGLKFLADVLHGQKTGFFLDQRQARIRVGELARGRRVLNLFGYTGAFSVHAAKGGAEFVTTVDVSRPALELAQKNFELNKLDPEDESRCQFLEADVMDLLRDDQLPGAPYDLIVCDPPAFAKHEKDLQQALKAYTDLNAACFRLLQPGGLLVTSSCSGRLDPDAFRNLLRLASGRAHRDVRILDWFGQPMDHAERLAYPEGRYLKTAVLEVR